MGRDARGHLGDVPSRMGRDLREAMEETGARELVEAFASIADDDVRAGLLELVIALARRAERESPDRRPGASDTGDKAS